MSDKKQQNQTPAKPKITPPQSAATKQESNPKVGTKPRTINFSQDYKDIVIVTHESKDDGGDNVK
jgi:hypothetical protein